jgi:hypothetical protein
MELDAMLGEMKAYRERIGRAIAALEGGPDQQPRPKARRAAAAPAAGGLSNIQRARSVFLRKQGWEVARIAENLRAPEAAVRTFLQRRGSRRK